MGFRFRRRVRILPGVRLNLSRSGISTSIGTRGLWATYGKRGRRLTVGLPGTGLGYTSVSKSDGGQQKQPRAQETPGRPGSGLIWALLALSIFLCLAFCHS
jgi:hypothetical protein